MNLRTCLLDHLTQEARSLWGERDTSYLGRIADEWLDFTGSRDSQYRLDCIRLLAPDVTRILDLGAGCGTFTFFALHRGLDAFGIEPEAWKCAVARSAVSGHGCERSWAQRILMATGEHLPFDNDVFDCVTTYQTLEHVQEVRACCREMLRVTRPGGCLHIRCPDFSLSTYEGHYRLPWLPGLSGKAAERYLRWRGRPVTGWRSLQMVGAAKLRRIFNELGTENRWNLRCVNIDDVRMRRRVHLPGNLAGFLLSRPLFAARYFRLLFSVEYPVHLGVCVDAK